MITLSKSGNTVTFTFDENSGYLQNGTIDVPVNSLSLIFDSSNMATFRKSASNDIFVSAHIAEFGMSKSELEDWYKTNMVGSTGGGGGTTPEEVQEMIDESISGKADTTAVTAAISSATADMATKTWVGNQGYITGVDLSDYATTEAVNGAISAATSGKADTTAVTAVNNTLTAHTANTNIHVTAEDKSTWNAKSDFSGSYNDLTDKPTIPTVPTDVSAFNNDAGYITADAISGKADTTALSNYIPNSAVTSAVTSASTNSEIPSALAVYAATSGVGTNYTAGNGIDITSNVISVTGKVDSSAIVTAITSNSTDSQIASAKCVYNQLGGLKLMQITQAAYDALVQGGTVDASTVYIIVN